MPREEREITFCSLARLLTALSQDKQSEAMFEEEAEEEEEEEDNGVV